MNQNLIKVNKKDLPVFIDLRYASTNNFTKKMYDNQLNDNCLLF